MSWPTAKLSTVAPAVPFEGELPDQEAYWLLNLDQVESHSGCVLTKLRAPKEEMGTSVHAFGEEHVLYSKLRPNLNKVVVPDEVGYCTSELVPLLPNPKKLDRKYLAYYLRSDDFVNWAIGKTAGAKMPRLNMKLFGQSEIPLPSLATQKHIARVLEQADQLRKQAQQMESELNQLAQSLFLEMFGDLFRNPKAWPIVELSGLITQGPKNGLYKHADDYGAGSPIIRIDNFYDGELTNHSTFKRVAATVAELDKFKIDENSILINRVNSPEYLGKAALVERLQEPTVFESNMMNFSVDTDRVNPLFLVTQLGSLYVKEQIRKASKDAVNQSSINQGDVQSFTVALPPIDYQNKFARRLSEIRLVRSMCLESKAVVDEAFNSLMQRAFNGELSAPERKAA